jgi:hypothetical protein
VREEVRESLRRLTAQLAKSVQLDERDPRLAWFFHAQHARERVAHLAIPLRRVGPGRWALVHGHVFERWARESQIGRGLLPPLGERLLDNRSVLVGAATLIAQRPELGEELLRVVRRSRERADLAVAAANAATSSWRLTGC